MMQYYSKWRGAWIDFPPHYQPTEGQLFELRKFHYQIRIKP